MYTSKPIEQISFCYDNAFNQPIDYWDTSQVTNMSNMLHFDNVFNQPIGDCDTSSVTNMNRMFCNMPRYNNAFNQLIDHWDTSQVTNMSNMSHFNSAFNQPIGDCDTSSVTNMIRMFRNEDAVNQSIDIWSKPVCSPQRPVGKPAHRPCNAQGSTAEVVSDFTDHYLEQAMPTSTPIDCVLSHQFAVRPFTCVSSVDRMPAVVRYPPGLHVLDASPGEVRASHGAVRDDQVDHVHGNFYTSTAGEPCDHAGRVNLLSDFAGVDMPLFALTGMQIHGRCTCFEIDPAARAFIAENHGADDLHGDVWQRTSKTFFHPDVVVAGFPCQFFSLLGLRQGWDDVGGRGCVVIATLRRIELEHPSVVLLENVASFRTADQGHVLSWIVDVLEKAGYEVHHKVLDTAAFGVPQSRKRWFLVGLLKARRRHSFKWPTGIEAIPLRAILGPLPMGASPDRCPGAVSFLASRNVANELRRMTAAGIDPTTGDYISDCDASENWCGRDSLTRSRRQGLWHIGWGARLSGAVTMRLQGLSSRHHCWSGSELELRSLAGWETQCRFA